MQMRSKAMRQVHTGVTLYVHASNLQSKRHFLRVCNDTMGFPLTGVFLAGLVSGKNEFYRADFKLTDRVSVTGYVT